MKWTEKITRFAVKNRKSPAENRRIVGKYLSFLAVALFGLFLANFAYIIAKGNMLLLIKNTSQQLEKFFM